MFVLSCLNRLVQLLTIGTIVFTTLGVAIVEQPLHVQSNNYKGGVFLQVCF